MRASVTAHGAAPRRHASRSDGHDWWTRIGPLDRAPGSPLPDLVATAIAEVDILATPPLPVATLPIGPHTHRYPRVQTGLRGKIVPMDRTPANKAVLDRLLAIQKQLSAVHGGGAALSNSSKGTEREDFVRGFLEQVMPPSYRFGWGDITDRDGSQSGQLDVVVENALFPSFPLIGGGTRLFLAEGVAAAIEVKSDLSAQWAQVLETARALSKVKRRWGKGSAIGDPPSERIPLFAVGYRGWSKVDTIVEHLLNEGKDLVDGILVIDPCLGAATLAGWGTTTVAEEFTQRTEGPLAMLLFLDCMYQQTRKVVATAASPLLYGGLAWMSF